MTLDEMIYRYAQKLPYSLKKEVLDFVQYLDWLICMISSQLHQYVDGFDEIIEESDEDFKQSGLKVTSVIRVGRLAVVSGDILVGAIGEISPGRLNRIRQTLAKWISGETING